jgi:hypothetical protein
MVDSKKGGGINENHNPLPNRTDWHLDCKLADTRDTPWLGIHTRHRRSAGCFLCSSQRTNKGQPKVNEKDLAERIIAEAQRWTENQFTLQDGVPGMTAQTRNEAKARIELIEHIKNTYKEMREIA